MAIAIVAYEKLQAGNPDTCRIFLQSLRENGVCFLENIGLDAPFLRAGLGSFFDVTQRPEAELRALVDPNIFFQRGPTPPNTEVAVATGGQPDLKWCWFIGDDELHANNDLWPGLFPKNIWPKSAVTFRGFGENLYSQCHQVNQVALRAVALGYRLPNNTFTELTVGGPDVTRLIHYLALLQKDIDQGVLWAGPHRDFNLSTLLAGSYYINELGNVVSCSDDNAGLHIETRSGEIILGRAPPNCAVFQIGQALEILTGGDLVATTHWVNAPKQTGIGRLAVAHFAHLNPNRLLYPFGLFNTKESMRKYGPPRLAGSYAYELLMDIGLAPRELAGKVFGYPNQGAVKGQY